MKLKYLLLGTITLLLCSCTNEIPLPKTPEETTIQWLKWNDDNAFDKLEKISANQTLDFIKYVEQSIVGMDDGNLETPPTVIQKITCINKEENLAECTYCCNEGEEETFILKKISGQWKVNDIISQDSDWDANSEEQQQLLDDLLGQ